MSKHTVSGESCVLIIERKGELYIFIYKGNKTNPKGFKAGILPKENNIKNKTRPRV
jgi:hypothetical protein